jgi:hypothetical protein
LCIRAQPSRLDVSIRIEPVIWNLSRGCNSAGRACVQRDETGTGCHKPLGGSAGLG